MLGHHGTPGHTPGTERITLTLDGAELGAANAMPGLLDWLAHLVAAEDRTTKNQYAGGSDECAHCEGSGRAGAPEDPYTEAWGVRS